MTIIDALMSVWYLCLVPLGILFVLFNVFSSGQRKFIFWRADAKCEDCGASWHSGHMLECHHVIPTHEGGKNDVGNGKLLCRPDHAKAHDKLGREAAARGDKDSASKNHYSARQIRKRDDKRRGW